MNGPQGKRARRGGDASVAFKLAAIGLLLACSAIQAADEVRIAVATNFLQTLTAICDAFEPEQKADCILSAGASGALAAQIVQGAPFDVFFSADVERPERLEAAGLTVPESRFTYATGRLVAWRPGTPWREDLATVLRSDEVRVIAIANPDHAPYGAAARDVLRALGAWSRPGQRIVQGESIGQAWQFVATGNADLGFIALSQVRQAQRGGGLVLESDTLLVDSSLYAPIEQQAVLLRHGAANPRARALLDFVRSPEGRSLIAAAGYAAH